MTTKTLIGLAAALVVLTVLAIYGQRGGDSAGAEDLDRVLLPELEPALDRIDRVAVAGAGAEPVATLLRREDRWVVEEKDDYPADIGRIREVLRALAEARIVERKTSNPGYYDRLGVSPIEDEDAGGVAVTAYAGDSEVAAVIVGDMAGTGYHYVRPTQTETSYMVDTALDVPRTVADWVDPLIVDVRGADVQAVEIEHPDGETLRISKEEPGQTNFTVEGVPDGRELQYAGVANVIGNALRELRLEDVAAAADQADQADQADDSDGDDTVRTTYRTFDGLVVTVRGTPGEDGAWVELEASTGRPAATPASDGAGQAAAPDPADGAGRDDAAGPAAAEGAAAEGAAAEGAEAEGAEADAVEADAASGADAADRDAGESDAAADPAARAAEINARVAGWRYRIPDYQFDQMTRRMEDLLKAEETADE